MNEVPLTSGRYVLYWMQAAQRAACNHARARGSARGPARAAAGRSFGLMDGYPEANLRHYAFMLEGLKETAAALAARGIRFVLRRGDPAEVALDLARTRR